MPDFEWDENTESKLLRNDISAAEAEECFSNPHTRRAVGDDMLMLGVTNRGRMLLVAYQQDARGVVRIRNAREQSAKERLAYGQQT